MDRLTKNDIRAEIISLEAEATRIKADLVGGDLGERQLEVAIRSLVEPRLTAAKALQAALDAIEAIPAIGVGR